MGFTLKENQVALVLTPGVDVVGDLTGSLDMSIALHTGSSMNEEAHIHMIDIVTMLASFMSYSADKPALLDMVAAHRDKELSLETSQELTPSSPTMGAA
jgi:hypothetical protein